MENAPTPPDEKVIELSAKKAGIVFALILIIAIGGFFVLRGKGSETAAEKESKALNQPPVAEFKMLKQCYPQLPCIFLPDGSSDPDGRIISYEWYLDGKLAATEEMYKVVGIEPNRTYNFTLIVYDDKKLSASKSEIISFKDPYKFNFPSASTKGEKISLIKSLCKSSIKLPDVPSRYYNGYISDLHAHLMPPTDPYDYAIAQLVVANELGVKHMALSQYGAGVEGNRNFEREKDKVVAEIAQLCPERFDAMLSAVYPDDPSSAQYVREQLSTGLYKGVGEIYIKNKIHGGFYKSELSNLANTTTMMEIYKILDEYNTPIHFHLDDSTTEDADALVQAMRAYPNVTFIWAHGCNHQTDLTNYFDNLYCEIEFYPMDVAKVYTFKANRLIIGTDSSVFLLPNSPVQDYHAVIENTRLVLAGPFGTYAPEIANENYQRLFNREGEE